MSANKYKYFYTSPDIQIEIFDHSPYIDVLVKHQSNQFKLLANYKVEKKKIEFEDILGNGFNSNYQSKGIGSILVNTALQYFETIMPSDSKIIGKMSSVGDPEGFEQLSQCIQIRSDFWKSFGFNILPGVWGHQEFKGQLSNVKYKKSGVVFNETPRFINLNKFKNAQQVGQH